LLEAILNAQIGGWWALSNALETTAPSGTRSEYYNRERDQTKPI